MHDYEVQQQLKHSPTHQYPGIDVVASVVTADFTWLYVESKGSENVAANGGLRHQLMFFFSRGSSRGTLHNGTLTLAVARVYGGGAN